MPTELQAVESDRRSLVKTFLAFVATTLVLTRSNCAGDGRTDEQRRERFGE